MESTSSKRIIKIGKTLIGWKRNARKDTSIDDQLDARGNAFVDPAAN